MYTGTRNIGCITLAISDTSNTATVTGNMLVVWVHTLGTACLDIETQANTDQADITILLHWVHFELGLFLIRYSF